LRRLQLTSNSERAAETARERTKYLEVRGTLEKTRMLVGQCVRREKLKSSIAAASRDGELPLSFG
jgi:hypothetical protein